MTPTLSYTCVGSGTCVPSAVRGPACHLVRAAGRTFVLDLGSGSLRSLAKLGVRPFQVDAVGLTHRHQDHVADLLPLLFALRHTPGERRVEPLLLFGYAGLSADVERLGDLYGRLVAEPGFPLHVRELRDGDELTLADGALRVRAHGVRHTPEAVGFRLGLAGGALMAYSGDSGATAALVDLADDVDLFVCESAFPDGHGVEGHLTPSQLLPLAERARAASVIATHFYPIWDELGTQEVWEGARRRHGPGAPRVTPAVDGLTVEAGAGAASPVRAASAC